MEKTSEEINEKRKNYQAATLKAEERNQQVQEKGLEDRFKSLMVLI